MLRKTLLIACLLATSGSAMAMDEFISRHGIAPRVSITFGSGHHDYDYDDTRYHNLYVQRPVYVQPVNYNYYRANSGRHYGWRNGHPQYRGWRGYDRYDEGRYHRRDNHRDHDDD